MTDAQVIPFPKERKVPSAKQLAERVHALSLADSFNIRMGEPHFRESLIERELDMRSVLEVLRRGRAIGRPNLDDYGDWRIEMRRKVAGRRVHVIVAVCADHIECITAW